jgi:hypothetical protein
MNESASEAQARSWYGVQLIYALGIRGGRLSIEQDFWLFWSPTAEDAFREALAGANAAERMGRALISGPVAVEALGFPELAALMAPPNREAPQSGQSGSIARMPGQSYSIYKFLGVRDLYPIGTKLEHGAVVGEDEFSKSIDTELRLPTPKNELLAFEPSGPAYEERSRDIHNADLNTRFKWYLAEECFQKSQAIDSADSELSICRRFVLIRADEPEEAYGASIADAVAREAESGRVFVGLRQLSLVTDAFRNACILRTDQYTVPLEQSNRLVKDKNELTAFRLK